MHAFVQQDQTTQVLALGSFQNQECERMKRAKEREREREGGGRERERERQTDRQTDRQTEDEVLVVGVKPQPPCYELASHESIRVLLNVSRAAAADRHGATVSQHSASSVLVFH